MKFYVDSTSDILNLNKNQISSYSLDNALNSQGWSILNIFWVFLYSSESLRHENEF